MDVEIQEPRASDDLIKQARENESQNSRPSGVEPKIKKKPGPKGPRKSKETDEPEKKDASEKPKFDIPTKVLCYPILKAASSAAVAYTKDPRAAMSPDEAEGIASAMGMVLEKWMPDAMNKWGPEIVLGVSLSQYGLRLYAIKQIHAKAEHARQEAPQNNGPRPQSPIPNLSVLSEETPVP